jgi:hypothetical protein
LIKPGAKIVGFRAKLLVYGCWFTVAGGGQTWQVHIVAS